jgi:hypothetical protein
VRDRRAVVQERHIAEIDLPTVRTRRPRVGRIIRRTALRPRWRSIKKEENSYGYRCAHTPAESRHSPDCILRRAAIGRMASVAQCSRNAGSKNADWRYAVGLPGRSSPPSVALRPRVAAGSPLSGASLTAMPADGCASLAASFGAGAAVWNYESWALERMAPFHTRALIATFHRVARRRRRPRADAKRSSNWPRGPLRGARLPSVHGFRLSTR